MSKTTDFLFIGGGLASAFSADTLRKEGALGSIVKLAEESFLPYFRLKQWTLLECSLLHGLYVKLKKMRLTRGILIFQGKPLDNI